MTSGELIRNVRRIEFERSLPSTTCSRENT